jgi:hypothetical protein
MDRIQLMEQASKTVSDVLNFFRDKTVSDVLDPDSYSLFSQRPIDLLAQLRLTPQVDRRSIFKITAGEAQPHRRAPRSVTHATCPSNNRITRSSFTIKRAES